MSLKIQGIEKNSQIERYEKIERLIDWFTKNYFRTMMSLVTFIFVVPVLVIGYTIITGQYNADVLFLPYKMS